MFTFWQSVILSILIIAFISVSYSLNVWLREWEEKAEAYNSEWMNYEKWKRTNDI